LPTRPTFRDEIMIFDKGDLEPKRPLTFNIEITDEGSTTGTALRQRRTFQNCGGSAP
jgi:hypothetical protein